MTRLNDEEEHVYSMGDDDEDDDEVFADDSEDSIEDEYSMGDDEEDEDIDEDFDASNYDSLDGLVVLISDYAQRNNLNVVQLRQKLFEETLRPLASQNNISYEDLIIASSHIDTGYNGLLTALYPAYAKYLSQSINEQNRPTLISLLGQALDILNNQGESDVTPTPTSAPTPPTQPSPVEDDEDEVDMMEVRNVVESILTVYDSLYAPCFVNRPKGILTAEGVVTLRSDGSYRISKNGKNYTQKLYSFINTASKGALGNSFHDKVIDSSFISPNGGLIHSYSPIFHLHNVFGLKSDGTRVNSWAEFRGYLRTDLTKKVVSVLKHLPDQDTIVMQSRLISLFTNCVIIDNFDVVKSLELRYKIDGVPSNLGVGLQQNSTAIFGKPFGEVVSSDCDEFHVYNLLYVFDMNAYTSEILFSYKSYENLIRSGNSPSLSRVVIGKSLSGRDYTMNLNQNTVKSVSILAGSRSGKGVLTLNILASVMSEGAPLLYLDYKPDMSATLWEMEAYLRGKGHDARIFSIDAKEGLRDDGVTPVRNFPFGMNAPSDLPLDSEHYKLFPYLKSLQLYCLLVKMRQTGKYSKNKKLFVVMDETQGFSRTYVPMLEMLADFKEQDAKGKKGAPPSPEAELAGKISNVFGKELKARLLDVRDITGGTGNSAMILLGQKTNPDEWQTDYTNSQGKTKTLPWKTSFAASIIASTDIKLVGKNAGVGTSYGIGNLKVEGIKLVDDGDTRGYWVKSDSAKPTDKSSTVFKSYLTLNKNDYSQGAFESGDLKSMPFTGGVLSGLSTDLEKQNMIESEFLDSNGHIRESIGLLGLMKLVVGDDEALLAQKVSEGYRAIETLFQDLGLASKYSCVEEYLFDCSGDSIFSYSELSDMLEGEHATDDTVDWLGDTTHTSAVLEDTSVQNSELTNELPINDWQSRSDDSDFDHMPDEVEGQHPTSNNYNPYEEEESKQSPPLEQQFSQPIPQQSNQPIPQQQERTNQQSGYQSPNEQVNYSDVYREPMVVPHNPFKNNTRSEGVLSTISAVNIMSDNIMLEIKRVFGDYSRIRTLEITHTGLVINDIAFRPQFDQEFIDSLPYDIKGQVIRGNILELFNFSNLAKFRNLEDLFIDNPRLAEGRVRRELGLSPRKTWYQLFKKFPSLQRIQIGGTVITDQASAQSYEDGGQGGYTLTEKLREKLRVPTGVLTNSRMEKVWSSKPVKVVGGAVGMTLGVKAVAVAASVFGVWGLLFGAFAGYGAYNEMKRRRKE